MQSNNQNKQTWRANTLAGGLLATALVAFAGAASAADLQLNLSDVESAEGSILIAIYDSEDNFRQEPIKTHAAAATKGGVQVTITDLPAGEYAVMLFQDINGNEKLDSNLFGLPKEPWGGSLNGKTVFAAPKWQDVVFSLADEGTAIDIMLR